MNKLKQIIKTIIPSNSKNRRYNCTLSNRDIAGVIDEIDSILEDLRYELSNALRIRLSAEESLLRWQDHFGPEHPLSVSYEYNMRRIHLVFRLGGESYNPAELEDELDTWSDDLMNCIGLVPSYTYNRGENRLTYSLSRQLMNPAVKLLLFVFLGIILGGVASGIVPHTVDGEVHGLLVTIQNGMSRMLNAIGSPVFFLTVTAAVIRAGKIRRSGNIGKTLMRRFIIINVIFGLIGIISGIFMFGTSYTLEMLTFNQTRNLIDFFLQIIPGDIVSPFIDYNSAQLVLMGMVVGSAVSFMGKEVSMVSALLNQLNALGLTLAEWISKLVPLFVTILVGIVIYSESSLLDLRMLLVLIPFTAITILTLLGIILRTSTKFEVPVMTVCKKMKDSFMIAFRTANVDESFGANLACCTNRFGINARLAEQSLPIGLVLMMPYASLSTTMFTLYVGGRFDAGGSLDWYLMLLFLAVSLSTAIPPIAGGGILTYSVIFAQLGIPMETLVLAMIMDTLFSFGVAAADQAILQLEMVDIADRTNMLDVSRLKKE